MSQVLHLWQVCQRVPFGRILFSKMVCLRAPYFSTIKATVMELMPGRSAVVMRQRRRVQNHLRGVHAIAQCNLCELAMGMLAEATIPWHLRWIPKGMTVSYLRRASGQLTAIAEFPVNGFRMGEVTIPVDVYDASGEIVMHADIVLHVSIKKTNRK